MISSRKKSLSLPARIALWSLPVLFVALVGGFLFLRMWINAYLESTPFRRLIGDLTSKQFKASGEYMPFHFAGTAIYSDAFKARGTDKAFFSNMDADQIRAEINLRGLWDHVWLIDGIDIQRVQISLGHTAAGAPAVDDRVEVAPENNAVPVESRFDWLPKRVDLRKVLIHEANLKWGERTPQEGDVNGAMLTLMPDGDAWNILCDGGKVSQKGTPDVTINQVRLRYQRPSLFITDGQLRYGSEGSIALSGEVNFDSGVDVRAKLSGIPVTPFLREDWRAKLKGNIAGDVKIRAPMPLQTAPQLEGSLSLSQGELEALPILNQIATFTRTQRFRKINLSNVSGNFTEANGKLTVTKFIAESEGLIRTEGSFTIANSSIDGTFMVGVTPGCLQWLPGSQTKVFTISSEGYLWTNVHLTGPLDNPKEDLTPRLMAAAAGTAVDTVQDILQQVPKGSLPDVPKKLIDDFVTPLLK